MLAHADTRVEDHYDGILSAYASINPDGVEDDYLAPQIARQHPQQLFAGRPPLCILLFQIRLLLVTGERAM